MTQGGREHATQCIRLVHTDAPRIAPQTQSFVHLVNTHDALTGNTESEINLQRLGNSPRFLYIVTTHYIVSMVNDFNVIREGTTNTKYHNYILW